MNSGSRFFSAALLFLTSSAVVYGQTASGGVFVLDRSLVGATQQTASDPSQFSLTGSVGEGFSQAAGFNQSIVGPLKRIYDGFLGTLKLSPSVSQVLSIGGGRVQITVPPGVIPLPYEPMFEENPVINPIVTNPSSLQQATQQLTGGLRSASGLPLSAVEFRILMDDDTLFAQPSATPLNWQMIYVAPQMGNILAYRFDETGSNWTTLSGGALNGGMASFTYSLMGIVAVFQQGSNEVGGAYAFPVPWRPHAGNATLYGTPEDGITFTHVPATGVIGIYNLAGELVRDIAIPAGSQQVRWDGKTGSGNDVASGVYIWTVESDGHRKTGKLMIIR